MRKDYYLEHSNSSKDSTSETQPIQLQNGWRDTELDLKDTQGPKETLFSKEEIKDVSNAMKKLLIFVSHLGGKCIRTTVRYYLNPVRMATDIDYYFYCVYCSVEEGIKEIVKQKGTKTWNSENSQFISTGKGMRNIHLRDALRLWLTTW